MLVHTYVRKLLKTQPKHIRKFARNIYIHVSDCIPTAATVEIQDNLRSRCRKYKWANARIDLESVPSVELRTGFTAPRKQVIVYDLNTGQGTVHKELPVRREYNFDYGFKNLPPDFSEILGAALTDSRD